MNVRRVRALGATLATALVAAIAASAAAHPAAAHAPSLHGLRARLAALTAPSVCHVRRKHAIRVAEARLSSAQACVTGCDAHDIPALRIAVQVARAHKCAKESSASEVESALKQFAARSNAAAKQHASGAPFNTLVLEPAGMTPYATIVYLHGNNGRATRILPVAQAAIQAGAIPSGVRVLIPQAWTNFITFRNMSGPSWFDLLGNDLTANWASEEIDTASKNITSLLDLDAKLYGTDRWKAGVSGVSQGGALALAVYVRDRVSAVSTISAFLPDPFTVPRTGDWKSRDSEAFLVHGDEDEVVDIRFARLTATILRRLGRSVKFVELPGKRHNLGDQFVSRSVAALDFVARRMVPGRGDWKPAPPPLVWSLTA